MNSQIINAKGGKGMGGMSGGMGNGTSHGSGCGRLSDALNKLKESDLSTVQANLVEGWPIWDSSSQSYCS